MEGCNPACRAWCGMPTPAQSFVRKNRNPSPSSDATGIGPTLCKPLVGPLQKPTYRAWYVCGDIHSPILDRTQAARRPVVPLAPALHLHPLLLCHNPNHWGCPFGSGSVHPNPIQTRAPHTLPGCLALQWADTVAEQTASTGSHLGIPRP